MSKSSLMTTGGVIAMAGLWLASAAAAQDVVARLTIDPSAVAIAARQGDFMTVDAAAAARASGEADPLIEAQRALSFMDFDAVAIALARHAAAHDPDPARRALAAGIAGEAAFTRGEYAEAAEALQRQADNAPGEASTVELAKTLAVARLLANVPPQAIRDGTAEDVTIRLDEAGLTRASALVNDQPIEMVIDTGANLSVLSAGAARRLGVRVIEGDAAIGSSTQDSVAARLGVADVVVFGGLTFTDVVFIVLDDDQLSFPNGYAIDGIVGFPLFHAAGGLTLTGEGRLRLQAPRQGAFEAPLRVDGNDLFAGVEINGEPLSLHVDTGASDTGLTALWVARFAPDVARGPRHASATGGAGGVAATEVTRLNDVVLSIGGARIELPTLEVELGSEGRAPKWFGTLGQDVLGRFEHYGFDLRRMRLVLGPQRVAGTPDAPRR